MKTAQWEMKSRIGSVFLVASGTGLRGIYWDRQADPMAASLAGSSSEILILAQTVRELEEYFRGERKDFTIPLEVEGTSFQKRVWEELKRIPYGTTVSYRDVAMRIRNGKAFRAVGTANGRNPISIIVPCHRVIAADGTLGGYGGGLPIKTKLLEIERCHVE